MTPPLIPGGDKLAIYLNDHLAGATGGLELARRVASSNGARRRDGPAVDRP
jgi:hypothetical protein